MTREQSAASFGPDRKSGSVPFRTSSWDVWCGLLLAPSAWLAMEGIGYYVAARACDAPGGIGTMVTHPRVVLSVLALILAVLAAIGLLIAVDGRRRARTGGRSARAVFLATASVFGSAVFTGGIVLFAIPTLVLDICSQARW